MERNEHATLSLKSVFPGLSMLQSYGENSLISKNNLVPSGQILPPAFPVAKKTCRAVVFVIGIISLQPDNDQQKKPCIIHFRSPKDNFRSLTFVSKD